MFELHRTVYKGCECECECDIPDSPWGGCVCFVARLRGGVAGGVPPYPYPPKVLFPLD